jgi:PAS domain S-box-containing protein
MSITTRPDGKPPAPQVKILVVDDQPANLLALRAILDDLGQELVEARCGEEALRRVQSDEFAVVLLDVLMPAMSGFQTAKHIRTTERSRHTPIIFLTAEDIDRAQLEEGYTLGAVDFLVKPLLPVALRAKVRGFIELFQEKQRARREAEQLRLLVHGTTDYAIFMLDPEGRIVTWNPGAERLKGYRAEEIIGQHFSRFYPPDAIERGWPEHELQVARTQGRFEDEGWRVRKDGSAFWANVVITALRDERGNLRGFSKVTRDLTERKKAEENARRLVEEATARRVAEETARLMQEQRERLQVTLASIGDAVISTDAEGRVDFLNPVAEELTGWKSEEAARRGLSEVFRIVNEETRQPVENPALRALREGTVIGLANHTVLISRDGTERPIDDSAAPIRDEKGRIMGVVLVFRDVTQRRRAEQALRESEERARSLLEFHDAVMENMGEGLYAVDTQGLVTYMNPAAESAFGWPQAKLRGRRMHDLTHYKHPDGTPFPMEDCAGFQVLHQGKVLRDYDDVFIRKDGTFFPVRYSSSPLRSGGKTVGLVVVFRDVTERKRTEEEITRLNGELHGRVDEMQAVLESLAVSERRLAAELEATTRLHALSTRLLASTDLRTALGDVLQEAIRTSRADFGNIQLYNPQEHALQIIAQQGFREDFLDYFRLVRLDEGSACAQAMQSGERIIIEDVEKDPSYERHRRIAAAAGYRAVQSTPLKSRKGAVVGMLSTHFRQPHRPSERDQRLLDLHARHAADLVERLGYEEALRRSEAQLRQLADSMAQIVWTARADGNIDYLNRRWTEFTGLPQTVSNDAWGQILHPDDARPAAQRWAACVHSGTSFEMELRLLDRRQQTYRWHLVRTVAVRDEAGSVARWFGTSTDIHEQKRAEESARYLAEASAALAGVVDYESTLQKVANLAVPYFADWSAVDLANEDGSLRRLAVAHQDPDKIALVHELMLEYPPEPQSPLGVYAVLRTGKPEIMSEIADELLVQRAKDERHLRLIRSLGLKSYICVPLVVSGKALGVLTFATAESGRRYAEGDLALAMDVANRAAVAVENTQLYQALRESDRRKDEFLATLAHELRNPLAPIRNSLQILAMPRVDAETARRARDMMERQVHQLVRLVDDLLDVSRVMRGKIELRRERVELATVVARAIETAQPLVDAHAHQLSVRLSSESLPIEADPVRLAQVVGNLLTNAAKYTEPNGRIWLTAERDGDMAVLRVRDNGIGIAPDMLPRVFELFVQVDNSSTKSQGGLGIGLTLVKNLVAMHNGKVEARSAGLGKGSEFVVRLPLSAQGNDERQVGEMGPQAYESPSPSGYRLLVVDDNQDAANSLAMLLRLQGHEVRVAYSGAAALEMTKTYAPDVVFLDIGMPGMDGYEVARRLRQQAGLEDVVLAALTGWGQQEDRRRTAEAGFNHHLVKPPEPHALEDVFARLSDDARA